MFAVFNITLISMTATLEVKCMGLDGQAKEEQRKKTVSQR